jgi:hypothetical protein
MASVGPIRVLSRCRPPPDGDTMCSRDGDASSNRLMSKFPLIHAEHPRDGWDWPIFPMLDGHRPRMGHDQRVQHE